MSVVIFIFIILVLVVVHEFGHFIAAKKSGMRVDEFGVGFPPRLFGRKRGDTIYSLNAIPFGGFVKIYGENADDVKTEDKDKERSFGSRPKKLQALVLVMGVVFNIIFAWILFSAGFMVGVPTSISSVPKDGVLKNPSLVITSIMADTPASNASLVVGDKILSLESLEESISPKTPEDMQNFILKNGMNQISISYERNGVVENISVTPEDMGDNNFRIGVALDIIGTAHFGPIKSFIEGARLTANITSATAKSFVLLIRDAFIGEAEISSLSGPVGIAGIVKDASKFGFANLLFFSAFISINLAVLNLIPFPALDGGRLLFLFIEVLIGKPLPKSFSIWANAIGFFALIGLMLFVTYQDILKLL